MRITWRESVWMALAALWSHRFRSGLTILGIVIGITTVVTVSSLLTGLRRGIVTFFQELGPDSIFLYKTSGDPNSPVVPPKEERRKPIRPEYAMLIKRVCPAVENTGLTLFVPPVIGGRPLIARAGGTDTDNLGLEGVTPNQFQMVPRDLVAGRFFTEEDDRRAARYALLGFKIAEALFPDGRAEGKTIQVDGAEYVVIGVQAKAKGGFFGENGVDYQVTIPLRTAQLRYPQLDRYMVVAKARPGMRQEAYEEMQGILRKVRRTPAGEPDDFALSTADQIIKQFDSITGLVVLISIAISGLGLLVGGIGVMNIMRLFFGVWPALKAARLDPVEALRYE